MTSLKGVKRHHSVHYTNTNISNYSPNITANCQQWKFRFMVLHFLGHLSSLTFNTLNKSWVNQQNCLKFPSKIGLVILRSFRLHEQDWGINIENNLCKTYSLKDIVAIKETPIVRFVCTTEMQSGWKSAFNLKTKQTNKKTALTMEINFQTVDCL